MKTYRKKNRVHFIGALVSVFLSNLFAVVLQFFKGNVLDFAVAGELQTTVQYALLLIAFILCEVLCYFCCQRFCARFVTGCTNALKQDIFAAGIREAEEEADRIREGQDVLAAVTLQRVTDFLTDALA